MGNYRWRSTVGFVTVTVFFILLAAFFMTETVCSQSGKRLEYEEAYYDEMEHRYIREMKNRLEAYGITDSGINMTHVSETGETRTYTVVIHNRQLKWISHEKMTELSAEIEAISFPDSSCHFFHEFVADKKLSKGV